MHIQYVASHSSGRALFEAFTSQNRWICGAAYQSTGACNTIIKVCTQAIHTSKVGQVGGSALFEPLVNDRRIECRTVSKAFSQLALWPWSRPVPRRHKKISLWSSPSRSRWSRPRAANTANTKLAGLMTTGQASKPALHTCARAFVRPAPERRCAPHLPERRCAPHLKGRRP